MCSHATVNDSDLLSFIWIHTWDLYLYLLGMYSTSELDELLQILNSIEGFKLDNHIGETQQYIMSNPQVPFKKTELKVDSFTVYCEIESHNK